MRQEDIAHPGAGSVVADTAAVERAGLLGTQLLAVRTLWWREIIRFVRQRSRLIGAFAQPIVFWLLLGGGFHVSFRSPGAAAGGTYLTYFYPGVIVLMLLFTAVFATIAVVEDRQGGFLQGVLVAPVARETIVLGQALGCTTLAVGQGALFLLFAPFAGFHLSFEVIAAVLGLQLLIAFALSSLGLIIAWRMDSTQGFHAIMNLLLIPMWLLSGAVFPAAGASSVLRWVMYVNPLTYGVAALRRAFAMGAPSASVASLPGWGVSLAVTVAFCLGTFWAAGWSARHNRGQVSS